MERLRQPNLSPASESVPHCRTTAAGSYDSITCCITLPKNNRTFDDGLMREAHRLENALVVLVVDPITEREIQRVIFPLADADVL